MQTIRQLHTNDKGEVYLKGVPTPHLQGPGALIQTVCSFIGTGSETYGILHARRDPGNGQTEHAMSYQSCGRILELSPEVTGYRVGDLVACAGSGFGAHAEIAYAPPLTFAKVPAGVSPAEAASCNLGLTAIHALRRSRFEFGETVVVIGMGMVGLLLCQMIRSSGGVAIGVELLDARLQLARDLGVPLALHPQRDDVAAQVLAATNGVGADAVIICAAAPDSSAPLELACTLARDKGSVVIAGLIKVAIPFFSLRGKELDLLVVRGRGPGTGDPAYERQGVDYPLPYVRWSAQRNLEEYLRMVAQGMVQVKPLITHRFPFTRAPEAVEALLSDPATVLGVVLDYDG
jgi:threonine dehydrogenase-like Zn-dependent dehydrogenase